MVSEDLELLEADDAPGESADETEEDGLMTETLLP